MQKRQGSPERKKVKKREKGRPRRPGRQYTSPEDVDAQLQAEKQKAREEEEQGEEGGDGAAGDPKKEKKSLDSDESEDEEDDYQQKRKGVEELIDIENPNRLAQTTKKVTQVDLDGRKELSRKEKKSRSESERAFHEGAFSGEDRASQTRPVPWRCCSSPSRRGAPHGLGPPLHLVRKSFGGDGG
ncbi:28 kDa heat- and acid-stable phosphoprotein-like [Cervus canadensis]|uniref:28 kDa heat- and acid-stable phosphoprotein-like n=1 Tax=Cervus canadensis TaxID=1574408 RepID=UPI001C9E784F|nr:28 kDa heat- and acid-stable phosphoprotein-like [Cervus canadensis]